jgi:ribosomal-protein-alanine N-acetyltransferase
MQVTVRELRDTDVERLARIEEASFSMPWSAKDFADLLAHPYCCYVVAQIGEDVVGCCGFTHGFGEAAIDNVVVEESCRGQGVAQCLLRELIARGDAMGIEAYTLEVRVSNAPAIHVYEKLGFVSEGIRPRFYERPTEDAMIMWRRKQP